MKHLAFWVDDCPRPEGLISELPGDTDYLVVGSGLTGLSAALRLAEAGKVVTVVDAGPLASGASAINGGMVSPDVKAGVDTIHARHGPEIAREMWQSTVRSVQMIHELNKRPLIDAITHRGGMAALGRGPRAMKRLTNKVAWYRAQFGVEWEVVQGSDLARIVGGDHFDVALYKPEGIGVHPARLSYGLAREVHAAGAVIVTGCAVTAVTPQGAGMEVSTTRGRLRAGEVIIATNGYTSPRPSPRLARRVVPIGSYIITTEPLGATQAEAIFPGGAMSYTPKRLLNYMRRTHDNRILIGGRHNLHTDLDLEESARELRAAMVRFWPELEGAAISHAWGGRLAVPFDLTPHIGSVDGVWYAMGYAGHGVGLAPQLGHELAGMLLGEDPPSVYSRIPHRGRFYYRGRPWFLTPASVLYRTLDRMGR